MDNPELWKISAEERTKHNATFMQLGPAASNGAAYLTGEQAKAFFLKSNLPMPVLGQIWNLADLNKDGKLDKKEFSIACYLIKKALTSPQGVAVIPAYMPKGLLVEPVVAASAPAPVNNGFPLIPPPQTTPQPLFTANFPPVVSPTTMTTPMPQVSLFPAQTTSATMLNPAVKMSATGSINVTPTPPPAAFVSPTVANFGTPSLAAMPTSTPVGAVFTPMAAMSTNPAV
jgi:hypothetical protein